MNSYLIDDIVSLNPWLTNRQEPILELEHYIPRMQTEFLLDTEWDQYCLVLVGPRRAGKTTLGLFLSNAVIQQQRYQQLLYLSCDFASIREHFKSPTLIVNLIKYFKLNRPVIFIDEVQRLENPGLLLKALFDLNLQIKLIASGSSQLEIKSKVQEYLTGREIEAVILPLSAGELPDLTIDSERVIFGSYPQVILTQKKAMVLSQLYKRYINKDIVEILQLSKPAVMMQLMTLIAHSSGQLVNYQQLATDCKVSIPTVQNYLNILEQTYVIQKLTPFVGNKRTEITSNPVYYFIDNGFRNQALRDFQNLETRMDCGLLIESFVLQELLKYRVQKFYDFSIHYWRTKSGAEVDFVLYKNENHFLPIEVKYRSLSKSALPRGYHSFLQAYQPKLAVMITKDWYDQQEISGCQIFFIPFKQLHLLFEIIDKTLINE